LEFEALLERTTTISLQEVCQKAITKGETPLWKGDKYVDEGVLFIRSENIREHGLDLSKKTFVPEPVHKRMSRSQIHSGDVLLAIVGATIGQVAVVPPEVQEANCNQAVAIIRPREDINPHYLRAVLQSSFGQTQIHRMSGGSARPNLDLWETRIIRVPVCPRPIQDRIAQVMQDAYAVRRHKLAEAERLHRDTNEFVLKALGVDMVKNQSHRRALVPVRSIAGGRFDFEAVVSARDISFDSIEAVLLREVVTQVNNRITPAEDCPEEDVNYISLGNIASNTGELAEFSPVKGTDVLSSSPKFQSGDILFGRMRSYLNKVWIAEFDGVCSGEAIVLRPNKAKVDTRFLHALLLSPITFQQVVPLQSGTSLPRVSASDILNIKLPIPRDLKRQREIADRIEHRRSSAKRLRAEAEVVVAQSKARVERMILGEET
jgi:type I restriction enzyme S subunit